MQRAVRKHDATNRRGEIVMLLNGRLALLDVVTVNDARGGISSEIYRVRGIEEELNSMKYPPVYRQRVMLEGR